MKKTLIVNGSPRENGHCAKVIKYMEKHLETTVINCFDNILHCTGCDVCQNGKCILNDKMQQFYTLIENADNIIFVSPLYFSMLTGGLLTFASRWQYFYHNPCKKQKKGAVILLGGGSTRDTAKAYSTADIIMRYANIKEPLHLDFIGTDGKDPLDEQAFTKQLDKIIDFMQ